jgi:hypothetical protein
MISHNQDVTCRWLPQDAVDCSARVHWSPERS